MIFFDHPLMVAHFGHKRHSLKLSGSSSFSYANRGAGERGNPLLSLPNTAFDSLEINSPARGSGSEGSKRI